MDKISIENIAKELVTISINEHKIKNMGKEKMSNFIKNNLTYELETNDYNKVLHLYNKYLSKEGYEIKKDINKFDIIDYTSDEYQLYINEKIWYSIYRIWKNVLFKLWM